MKKYKPVAVSSAAFAFCRLGLAVLLWLSLIWQSVPLLIIVLLILVLSAILGIRRAPMIVLYSYTINKIIKSKNEIVNEHAMRFAHIMGSALCLICLLILVFVNANVGWVAVFCFALLKSISALGFCPASKLFDCATNDSCCAIIKKYGR